MWVVFTIIKGVISAAKQFAESCLDTLTTTPDFFGHGERVIRLYKYLLLHCKAANA